MSGETIWGYLQGYLELRHPRLAPFCVCVSWSSSYVFVYYSAYRPEIGRTNKLHRTCTPTARRRGRAGVENESAEVSATRSTCRALERFGERTRGT